MIRTRPLPGLPAVTVVMYHYVRPLADSAFPRLKALDLADFRGQLAWLRRHYTPISGADLRAALLGQGDLPATPCLLTFDDGYSDHFDHAFPLMAEAGVPGLFFAPRASLLGRQMLEVNKIQFTLASLADPARLADEVDALLTRHGLADPAALRAAHFAPNRYDGAAVAYAKRLLQFALPDAARTQVVDALFHRHVTADAAGFAEGLYLTAAQAGLMRAAGMEFGGHGDRHLWHGQCSADDLAAEVAGSVTTLQALNAPVTDGFYCYPFGSEGPAVGKAVSGAGFALGFTVTPALCAPEQVDPLRIPRLDTNDLPHDPTAGPRG